MPNCGHCHTCGEKLRRVLDGEEWCDHCNAYRRYRSHGWDSKDDSTCPRDKIETPESIFPILDDYLEFARHNEDTDEGLIEYARQNNRMDEYEAIFEYAERMKQQK